MSNFNWFNLLTKTRGVIKSINMVDYVEIGAMVLSSQLLCEVCKYLYKTYKLNKCGCNC